MRCANLKTTSSISVLLLFFIHNNNQEKYGTRRVGYTFSQALSLGTDFVLSVHVSKAMRRHFDGMKAGVKAR